MHRCRETMVHLIYIRSVCWQYRRAAASEYGHGGLTLFQSEGILDTAQLIAERLIHLQALFYLTATMDDGTVVTSTNEFANT